MRFIDLVFVPAALGVGIQVGSSTDQWMSAADQGAAEVETAKRELLASADLDELHHKIYEKVGQQVWESRVKPRFMSAITLATVRDTGNLLPDWRDIVQWTRAHPQDARRLLEEAAAAETPAPPGR